MKAEQSKITLNSLKMCCIYLVMFMHSMSYVFLIPKTYFESIIKLPKYFFPHVQPRLLMLNLNGSTLLHCVSPETCKIHTGCLVSFWHWDFYEKQVIWVYKVENNENVLDASCVPCPNVQGHGQINSEVSPFLHAAKTAKLSWFKQSWVSLVFSCNGR